MWQPESLARLVVLAPRNLEARGLKRQKGELCIWKRLSASAPFGSRRRNGAVEAGARQLGGLPSAT